MGIQDEQYLTVKEVATYLRISKPLIYRLIHGGDLEAIRVGHAFRVTVTAADKYLKTISTAKREEII